MILFEIWQATATGRDEPDDMTISGHGDDSDEIAEGSHRTKSGADPAFPKLQLSFHRGVNLLPCLFLGPCSCLEVGCRNRLLFGIEVTCLISHRSIRSLYM